MSRLFGFCFNDLYGSLVLDIAGSHMHTKYLLGSYRVFDYDHPCIQNEENQYNCCIWKEVYVKMMQINRWKHLRLDDWILIQLYEIVIIFIFTYIKYLMHPNWILVNFKGLLMRTHYPLHQTNDVTKFEMMKICA